MNKKVYEVTSNWQVISISLNKIVKTIAMTISFPFDKTFEKLLTMTEDLLQGQNCLFLLFKQHDFYAPE